MVFKDAFCSCKKQELERCMNQRIFFSPAHIKYAGTAMGTLINVLRSRMRLLHAISFAVMLFQFTPLMLELKICEHCCRKNVHEFGRGKSAQTLVKILSNLWPRIVNNWPLHDCYLEALEKSIKSERSPRVMWSGILIVRANFETLTRIILFQSGFFSTNLKTPSCSASQWNKRFLYFSDLAFISAKPAGLYWCRGRFPIGSYVQCTFLYFKSFFL